ncbi:MAG: CRISPR-associated endonuclease Cas6 [Spirosomataceae bacterium]
MSLSRFVPIGLPKLVSSAEVIFPDSQWPHQSDAGRLRSKIIKLLKPDLKQEPAFYPLHNHVDSSLSVIYYRIINDIARIGAIGEGTHVLKHYLTTFFEVFETEKEFLQFYHFDYRERLDPIGFTDSPITYCITDWLPFSERGGVNFKKEYDFCKTEEQRKALLRLLLKDQILALLRRLDYDAAYQLSFEVASPQRPVLTYIKKYNKLLKFNLLRKQFFRVNFQLPPQVAFGEHTSIGFGRCELVNH